MRILSMLFVGLLLGSTHGHVYADTVQSPFTVTVPKIGEASPSAKKETKPTPAAEPSKAATPRVAKQPPVARATGAPIQLLPNVPVAPSGASKVPVVQPIATELVRLLQDPNLLGRILSAPVDPRLTRADIVTNWLTAGKQNLPCTKPENCSDLKKGYNKLQFIAFVKGDRVDQLVLGQGGITKLPSEYGGSLMEEIGRGVTRASCVAYVTLVFSNMGEKVFVGPYPTSDHLGHYRNLPAYMKLIPAEGGKVFLAMAVPFTIVRGESRAIRVHLPEWIFDGTIDPIVAIQLWRQIGSSHERVEIRFLPEKGSVADTMFSTPVNLGLGRSNDLKGPRPAFPLIVNPC